MEFRKFVEKALGEVSLDSNLQSLYGYISAQDIDAMSDAELENVFFEKNWVSGGINGNSCYGRSPRSVEPSSPEDITPDLAKVLIAVEKSDINFLTYMSKIQPLIKSIDFSMGEDYYGNYYNYSRLYVNLKELYDALYSAA